MKHLSVRPLERDDIPRIVDYWANASPEYLLVMGADPEKIPRPDVWQANLEMILSTPEREAETFYLIWLVDGQAIGFNSLKNIVYGEHGDMHLHIWEKASRGKGYGGTLFCLATVEFFRRFELKTIYCEPSASNHDPNRMLQKVGFPLILTHTAASSEISLVCELNRYNIDRTVAEAYLDSRIETDNPAIG